MGSDSCQVLSGKMIWARLSRAQALGEMPERSVFSSNTSQFRASHPGGQDVVGRLCCSGLSSCRGTGDKSVGSHPRSPDVPLNIKSLRASALFFFKHLNQ